MLFTLPERGSWDNLVIFYKVTRSVVIATHSKSFEGWWVGLVHPSIKMADGALTMFKSLNIDRSNVSMSRKSWYNAFYLAIEFKTFAMGNDTDGALLVTMCMKILALLHAVAEEGRSILVSQRQEVTNPNLTYDTGFWTLVDNFQHEESV